jgi:hypothetical protein
VRVLASVALIGIQQAVPGPIALSLLVTAVAALAGRWALATLRA